MRVSLKHENTEEPESTYGLDFETMKTDYGDLHRLKIHGGWLLLNDRYRLLYIPDPKHEWIIKPD